MKNVKMAYREHNAHPGVDSRYCGWYGRGARALLTYSGNHIGAQNATEEMRKTFDCERVNVSAVGSDVCVEVVLFFPADGPCEIISGEEAVRKARGIVDEPTMVALIEKGQADHDREEALSDGAKAATRVRNHVIGEARHRASRACRYEQRLAALNAELAAEYAVQASAVADEIDDGNGGLKALASQVGGDEAAVLHGLALAQSHDALAPRFGGLADVTASEHLLYKQAGGTENTLRRLWFHGWQLGSEGGPRPGGRVEREGWDAFQEADEWLRPAAIWDLCPYPA